jgi:hypothetical protein
MPLGLVTVDLFGADHQVSDTDFVRQLHKRVDTAVKARNRHVRSGYEFDSGLWTALRPPAGLGSPCARLVHP